MKRYHFCSLDFLEKLTQKGIIEAGPCELREDTGFAYQYLFHEKAINHGNGMFFLWENPWKKGKEISSVEMPEAQFAMLELEIPDSVGIDMDYDNWCSFLMDLEEADGDYQVADEICNELGIVDGLEGSYRAIYAVDDSSNIQTLVPYLKSDWVASITYTTIKVV